MDELKPSPGDLVVIVARWRAPWPHPLNGVTATYMGGTGSSVLPWRVVPLGGRHILRVREVRPLTPEELTAHWLAQGSGGPA